MRRGGPKLRANREEERTPVSQSRVRKGRRFDFFWSTQEVEMNSVVMTARGLMVYTRTHKKRTRLCVSYHCVRAFKHLMGYW